MLCWQSNKFQASGNIPELENSLEHQHSFLAGHLLNWVEGFAEKLQDNPANVLYPPAAQSLALFLKSDLETIAEVQAFNRSQRKDTHDHA